MICESDIEEFAIKPLEKQDCQYIYAPSIVPNLPACDAQASNETPERIVQ